MREIKVQATPVHSLHSPDQKHELRIMVSSNMIDVIHLTDGELAQLREQLAAYQPHSGHYGVTSHGCATPECGIPEHQPMDAQNPDYGAASDGHLIERFRTVMSSVVDGWVSGAKENHEGMGHRGEMHPCWEIFAPDDIRRMVDDACQEIVTAQNPAYGADGPLCTPGRRLGHEHSVACGPMAGECVTPGHVHVHPESIDTDNSCTYAQDHADGDPR